MKTNKFLLALTIILNFSQCGSTNFETSPPFEIESAIYHAWTEGQSRIRGLNVTIQLKSTSTIEFDTCYFRKRSTKIEVRGSSLLIANFTTSPKNVTDIILHSDPIKEFKNKIPEPNKFPFKLKENEAVLGYPLNGKKRYVKIKDLKQRNTSSFTKLK